MNARQAANACAAKDAQQNCFRLIVKSVRSRNFRDAAAVREFAKKTVAQFARVRLDTRTGASFVVFARTLAPVNRRGANM